MGGKASLLLAGCIFAGTGLLALLRGVQPLAATDEGLCLPSPQAWGIPAWLSFGINIALVIFSALLAIAANRRFNFIPGTSVIFASAMLLMAAACLELTVALNSSTLMLVANMVALWLIFGQYDVVRRNPGNIFVVATLFSIGSMFHYSFIFFIAVYAVAMVLLKAFGLREFTALLLGVIAPYWIAFGLGFLSVDSLRVPVIGGFWQALMPGGEMLWMIVATALTAFVGLMFALKNVFFLYSASTSIRAYNYAMTLPAAACLILIMVDWENFLVYYMSLCLFTGLECGYINAFAQRHRYAGYSSSVRRISAGFVIYWLIAAVYTLISLMSIYNV